MLHLRVLSALVGIPVTILTVWYGGIALWIFTVLIYLFAGWEIALMLKGLGLKPNRLIVQVSGLILLTSAYLYKDENIGPVIVLMVIGHLLTMVLLYPHFTPTDVFGNLTASLYVGNIVFLFLTRNLPNGWIWVLLLLTATWASDTFAYFVGRAIGKHKLAPLLSPKKTVEGAVGGLLGAVLIGYLFGTFNPQLNMTAVILLGVLIGIASLMGDLVESAFKRQAKVKDSSQIIPGHGGVLDRFDSLLLTAPLVYYVVKLFII
ncbi:phosphatidate cytidylyltransferase [Desulfotomaculum nigrificans]|uniref:phosphatidate cytidylyltransferase n=1 Tax=Desulfotomaculum nigrificans TaxID=1565 RepID=UPI0001FAF0B1|nr:phosphatidate cytidylyltransferase [Desulfotomaculum nigrificans]